MAFKAGEGSIFIQYGPNRPPAFLGCHGIDELSQSQGDINLIWCKDPAKQNGFVVAGSYRDAPEPPAFTITEVVADALSLLEDIQDKLTVIINYAPTGRPDDFLNWQRSTILTGVTVTSLQESPVSVRTPDDQSEVTKEYEFGAENWYTVYNNILARQVTTEANPINGMAASKVDPRDKLVACADAGAGVTANVLITTDGGSNWAATAADPHAVDEDLKAIVTFPVSSTVERILVVRGPSVPVGTALEVAYSDNNGVSWSPVTVGSTINEGAIGGNALFALDKFHIWLVTDGGKIYFSADGGVSWTSQASGVVTALNAIHFIDNNNGIAGGASGVILVTADGGDTWSLAATTGTTDPVMSVFRINATNLWVGVDKTAGSQTAFYSEDNGDTWASRTFAGSGAGQVNGLEFEATSAGQIGYMISDSAAPVGTVLYTRDGGANWETLDTPTNTGLNKLVLLDKNRAFVAGAVQGGSAVIVKVSPKTA